MRLTKRDSLIIDELKKQDFCFYKDISKKFFSSDVSASKRLKKLKDRGWIIVEPLGSMSFTKIMDKSSTPFIGHNKKIIRLRNKFKIMKRKTSLWKIKHQLLLFSLKERLEKFLHTSAVFENDIRDLREALFNGKDEPLPDFYLEGLGYRLAIELELHLKSRGRYFLKMAKYRRSCFTHILYFVTNARKMDSLMSAFRYRNYMGIAHYSDIESVFCHRYGKLPLLEWLEKDLKKNVCF